MPRPSDDDVRQGPERVAQRGLHEGDAVGGYEHCGGPATLGTVQAGPKVATEGPSRATGEAIDNAYALCADEAVSRRWRGERGAECDRGCSHERAKRGKWTCGCDGTCLGELWEGGQARLRRGCDAIVGLLGAKNL